MTDDARVPELEFLAMLNHHDTPTDVGSALAARLGLSQRRLDDMVLALIAENCVTGERPCNPRAIVHIPSAPQIEDPKRYFWAANERTSQSILAGQPYQLYLSHFGRLRLARLRAELDRGRSMDPTGILVDQRHVERDLVIRFAMAGTGSPVSVMMADLDHFKDVNDRLGHNRGDDAIRRYFSVLRDMVTEDGGDAYRNGGDETVAILAGAGIERAQATAERVRRAVEAEFLHFDAGLVQPPTVSIGVGTFQAPAKPAFVLASVDRLLYRAKGDGRNRVVAQTVETIVD
jgi:diguanylate cyclase (GGDEF)-like protein